jgi:hypothetical protein
MIAREHPTGTFGLLNEVFVSGGLDRVDEAPRWGLR